MVTHDESSARAVSHRILFFLDGRIVDQKTPRRPA
jgi:ABC-type polar amino acid transport system ATPase subunit